MWKARKVGERWGGGGWKFSYVIYGYKALLRQSRDEAEPRSVLRAF